MGYKYVVLGCEMPDLGDDGADGSSLNVYQPKTKVLKNVKLIWQKLVIN